MVTGHTGFKGAWLSEWLGHMGSIVSGFALPPSGDRNLYAELQLNRRMDCSFGDIRDRNAFEKRLAEAGPEIVFHLAAQPLVRQSYAEPVETFETNVMGTVNVLDAIRRVDSVRSVVVVTSDKCYQNREWSWGYRENEALGGEDPYSSSKAAAELVTHAFRSSFFRNGVGIATVRAGNVIGGGDWSPDRLVPDLVNAAFTSGEARLRYPGAIRPWQHVLEPLCGYLTLARRLFEDPGAFSEAWNFGPRADDMLTVAQVAERVLQSLGHHGKWIPHEGEHPHEAGMLSVDSSKAAGKLGWRARLTAAQAIEWTGRWYREWHAGASARELTAAQIEEYCAG